MKFSTFLTSGLAANVASALGPAHVTYQDTNGTILRSDNGTYGPAIEEVHYYYGVFPPSTTAI